MHHRVHPTASPPSVVMQTANLEGGSSAPGLGEVMRAMQDLMTRMDRLEQSRVHGQPPPPPPRVVADPQARSDREPQNHRPRISPEEWQRRKDNHLCFVCGADDHISRECPGKQQQQQEQLANTILEEESDSGQSEDGDQ